MAGFAESPLEIAAKSDSATLQAKIVGFDVSRKKPRATVFSSGVNSAVIAGFPAVEMRE